MSLPYIYRDYPLVIYMGMVVMACGFVSFFTEPLQSVEITIAPNCCTPLRCPVVDSLSDLPSVQKVRHQTGSESTIISLLAGRTVSAKQIWDAVEAVSRRPQRILIDRREIKNKPIN